MNAQSSLGLAVSALVKGNVKEMCRLLLQNEEISSSLYDCICKQLTSELDAFCGMKDQSILRSSSPQDLKTLTLHQIWEEIKTKAPKFHKLMLTLCVSSGTAYWHGKEGAEIRLSKVAGPAAIVLNARCPPMKAWALKNSISLQYSGCTNMVSMNMSNYY